MIRTYAALLLLASLPFLPHADARWQPYPPPGMARNVNDVLSGDYSNVSGGGTCQVRAHRRGYLFVNEHGSQAFFGYTAPGMLRMISGSWDPNTTVTVSRDRRGRTILCFQEPNTAPGYWVSH